MGECAACVKHFALCEGVEKRCKCSPLFDHSIHLSDNSKAYCRSDTKATTEKWNDAKPFFFPLVLFTVPSPSALRLDATASFGTAREVIAIKDYCPSSFRTLKFSKGDLLYVLDSSGGEWWYAHNNTEMGYIPAAYVQPVNYRDSSFSDSGMIDTVEEASEEAAKEIDLLEEWTGVILKTTTCQNGNPFVGTRTSTNPFLNGSSQGPLDQNSNEKPVDLLLFDTLAPSEARSARNTTNMNGSHGSGFFNLDTTTPTEGIGQTVGPFAS